MTETATEVVERPILFSGPMIRAILGGKKTQTRRIISPQPHYSDGHKCWMRSSGRCTYDMNHRRREVWDRKTGHLISSEEYQMPVDEWLLEMSPRKTGDRLWVRETFCSGQKDIVGYNADATCGAWMGGSDDGRIWINHGFILESPNYRECFRDGYRTYGIGAYGGKWKPSIHMPRWASRITLEVTDVRVERVQEITEDDSLAEGCDVESLADEPVHVGEGHWQTSQATPKQWFANLWDSINDKRGFGWAVNPWCWCISFKVASPQPTPPNGQRTA